MKSIQFYSVLFTVMLFLQVFTAISAHAHGTDCRMIEKAGAVTFEFFYDDREPMQYSEVLVFSPDDDRFEYQNGRTDSKGRFSFYPDSPGKWRIEVNDGMGHMVKGYADIEDEPGTPAVPGSLAEKEDGTITDNVSKPLKAFLGLSIIINIWAAFIFVKHRSGEKK